MSLDIYLQEESVVTVVKMTITHNLIPMAQAAGIYDCLWHPEQLGIQEAGELVPHLVEGLKLLDTEPEKFRALNPDNGWGDYDGFRKNVALLLTCCREHPEAKVVVSI